MCFVVSCVHRRALERERVCVETVKDTDATKSANVGENCLCFPLILLFNNRFRIDILPRGHLKVRTAGGSGFAMSLGGFLKWVFVLVGGSFFFLGGRVIFKFLLTGAVKVLVRSPSFAGTHLAERDESRDLCTNFG